MYSGFGVQWVCLNRGPCWEYEEDTEIITEVSAPNPLLTSTPEVTEPHESATDVAKGTEQIISSILDIHIGDSCSTIHSGSIPNVTGSESDVDLLSMAIQMTGIDDLESLEADVDPESIQRQTVTEESVQRQTVSEDSLFS